MKQYFGEYLGEKVSLGVEVYFNIDKYQPNISLDVYVLDKERRVLIKQLEKYNNIIGPEEVYIEGLLSDDKNEIQINNIQRGIIASGQDFMAGCINQLLAQKPLINSIYLYNIDNAHTLGILKKYKKDNLPLSIVDDENKRPLMSALEKCGFIKHEIVLEGTTYYGIRSYR